MSSSQVLSGTPAGISVPSGADSFLGLAATVASAAAVGGASTAGYVEWLEGTTAGATQRNFRRWVGLGLGGVSRKTVEDFGYDNSLVAPANIQRYTQYKPVSAAFGALSQSAGEILLNWGLLDQARSGTLTPANTVGGVFAGPILTINATDLVWFFPQTIGAAPFVVPTLVSVQPGVGFTINAAIPAGETWRYLVVAGPAVV
jgi:hypothetical protein